MKKSLLLFVFYINSFCIYAQNPEWINYTNGNTVLSSVVEGEII